MWRTICATTLTKVFNTHAFWPLSGANERHKWDNGLYVCKFAQFKSFETEIYQITHTSFENIFFICFFRPLFHECNEHWLTVAELQEYWLIWLIGQWHGQDAEWAEPKCWFCQKSKSEYWQDLTEQMNSTLKKKRKETFANLVFIAQNVQYYKRGKMVP